MKKSFLVQIFLISFLLSSEGCAFFGKSSYAKEPRPQAPTVRKQEAIRLAKDFASEQGFGDEFLIQKPSKVVKQLTLGQNPHWVWQVYFPHKSQTLTKFYKKSPLMVEVNAVTGKVENWGRR